MSDHGVDVAALEPFPDSIRVQRAAAAMLGAIERADAVGRPKIRLPEIPEPRSYDVAQVDPDPANMSRLKVTKTPREIERPETTWEAFERYTPQFFLRNTHRLERYADASLFEYTYVPDGRVSVARISDALRQARAPVQPEVDAPLGSAAAIAWRAERAVLMEQTAWNDHYGRPDPAFSE